MIWQKTKKSHFPTFFFNLLYKKDALAVIDLAKVGQGDLFQKITWQLSKVDVFDRNVQILLMKIFSQLRVAILYISDSKVWVSPFPPVLCTLEALHTIYW